MAIDNHPRIRRAAQLARKKPQRETHDRILIVCEGEKTEVSYFDEIRKFYKLNTAHVKVCNSEYGTSPLQVVQYGIDFCKRTCEWERVFCVIDRDDHDKYEDALKKAQAHKRKIRNDLKKFIEFKAIPSNPSFEIWLLMHFQRVERFMHRDEALKTLRDKFILGYEKGQGKLFEKTRDHLDVAYKNASGANARRQRVDLPGMDNPSTCVDELVKLLCDLKR